jgi:hypothetical protein
VLAYLGKLFASAQKTPELESSASGHHPRRRRRCAPELVIGMYRRCYQHWSTRSQHGSECCAAILAAESQKIIKRRGLVSAITTLPGRGLRRELRPISCEVTVADEKSLALKIWEVFERIYLENACFRLLLQRNRQPGWSNKLHQIMNDTETAAKILDEITPIRREVFRSNDPEVQLKALLKLFPFKQ